MGSIYATQADRNAHGVPPSALGTLTSAQIDAALASASAKIDSFFRGRYALPLQSWGVEVTQACVYLADYQLLSTRGYNPAAGGDANVLQRYQETNGGPDNHGEGWLQRVQRRAAHPDVVEFGGGGDAPHLRPRVISSSVVDTTTGATATNRGW